MGRIRLRPLKDHWPVLIELITIGIVSMICIVATVSLAREVF